MNVTIDEAVLDGYKTFIKKNDLEVYSQFNIKYVEQGQPSLINNFQDEDVSDWTSKTIVPRELVTLTFGETSFDALLAEIKVRRNLDADKVVYTFVFTKKIDENELKDVIIPYFKARELVPENEQKPSKRPKPDKYRYITYPATLKKEEVEK